MTNMAASRRVPIAATPQIETRASLDRAPDLSALEWLVVEMARHDSLSSLSAPNAARRLIARLFGVKAVNRLADSRLESLRRISVHGWRRGGKLPDAEVDGFLAAGFSFDQLMLVLRTVEARRG